jgi:hypothetical protein
MRSAPGVLAEAVDPRHAGRPRVKDVGPRLVQADEAAARDVIAQGLEALAVHAQARLEQPERQLQRDAEERGRPQQEEEAAPVRHTHRALV